MAQILIIQGNLLDAPLDRVLCHQVNCQGVMGSGVAKAISNKYPVVKDEYLDFYKENKGNLLGNINIVETGKHRVINMFAQEYYGRDRNICYTSYEAFRSCLQEINSIFKGEKTLAFPYGIGCGLGGGKWEQIYTLMLEHCSGQVELYRL
jgi:Predicted phosphatase homologous to the C-terminal domain of histone macroH2A1